MKMRLVGTLSRTIVALVLVTPMMIAAGCGGSTNPGGGAGMGGAGMGGAGMGGAGGGVAGR